MTGTVEVNINEALALIDQGLAVTMGRELMSSNEVTDMLLDVRTILAAANGPGMADESITEPVPAAIQ